MLDLCLIRPRLPYLVDPTQQAHLGLMMVAALAERQGRTVRIVDLAALRRPVAEEDLPRAGTYGVTGTYLDAPAVREIVDALLAREQRPRIIVGGLVSLSPDLLPAQHVDIVRGGADGGPLARAPEPARHLWPGPQGGVVFTAGDYFPGGSTVLLSSRGCPFACAFCASPSLRERRVQFRSPRAVVEEMERCAVDFGVRQFRFADEHLTASRRHCVELCREILRSRALGYGRRVAWRASVGVQPHDFALFALMRRAGCRELSFGVESADPEVLRVCRCRKGGPDHALAALSNARRAGIVTRALMIVGLPGTRRETAALNRRFLGECAAHRAAITVFAPVPGCAVAADPAAFGCRIITDAAADGRGLCLFRPGGRMNPLEPRIEVEGLSLRELRASMRDTVRAAVEAGLLQPPRGAAKESAA